MARYLQIRPADSRGIIQLGYLFLDGKRAKKKHGTDGFREIWGEKIQSI